MTLLKSYYELCKPNVVYMMLICAFVGMLLAEESVESFGYLLVALTGIAFCAASAAAINQVIDRKSDASMARTDQRPLPQGELSATHASIFALIIGLFGANTRYLVSLRILIERVICPSRDQDRPPSPRRFPIE